MYHVLCTTYHVLHVLLLSQTKETTVLSVPHCSMCQEEGGALDND